MSNLIKKIQNFAHENDLFKKGDKILLAVSGGPDSVFMLDFFSKIEEKKSLSLVICHVNYGLRGNESDLDEKLVVSLGKKYGLPVEIIRSKVIGKSNLESRLRDIRYLFFEEIRKKRGFDWVAVAHNSDDQVETFLMRLIRGSGTAGLSVMKAKSGRLIRPLLFVSRREIEKYLLKNKLRFRIDKTNRQSVFLRNKIRNRLIPYLEKNFNPSIKKTLSEALISIAEDQELLSSISDDFLRKRKNDFLGIKNILSLPPAIAKRVILSEILRAKGDLSGIGAVHVREIWKIIRSTKGKNQVVVFRGLKIRRKGGNILISKDRQKRSYSKAIQDLSA